MFSSDDFGEKRVIVGGMSSQLVAFARALKVSAPTNQPLGLCLGLVGLISCFGLLWSHSCVILFFILRYHFYLVISRIKT